VKSIRNGSGGAERVKQAEEFARKWGGLGIFFSRWLVTPLGPWLNLTSGIASYSWPRFVFWDALGNVIWVVLYVLLGYFFNDRVQEIAALMGDLSWVVIGLIAATAVGWKLISYLRSTNQGESAAKLRKQGAKGDQSTTPTKPRSGL